ncbi:MAG: cupredoxin domain-containing protein [Gaiellaceae bacterium]
MRNERSRRLRYGLLGAGFALALAGAAVGGLAAGPGAASPKVQIVTVTEKEFSLAPSTKQVSAGKVTFVAVNKGKFPHALAIAGTGVKTKTAVLAPGKSARLTVTLKNGSYSIWCPVGNHAALGMKLALKVGGGAAASSVAATPSPASTTPAATGDGGGGGWG